MADENNDLPFDDSPWDGVVPDLEEIPQEEWKETLRALHPIKRKQAMLRLGLERGGPAAMLLHEIDMEEQARRLKGVPTPAAPRTTAPAAQDPATRIRQVNLQLQPKEYERLAQAAERLGMRPTVLARLLVARGVELTLRA